jgi:hypothetical protein
MLLFPYFGATHTTIQTQPITIMAAYVKNPGERMNPFISWMVDTEDCSGALITITMDPTIHMKQPIFPTKDRRSPRNIEDRMAVITTDYPAHQ